MPEVVDHNAVAINIFSRCCARVDSGERNSFYGHQKNGRFVKDGEDILTELKKAL
jgi:hypothetical protein